jgi:Mg2+-importing ATPase
MGILSTLLTRAVRLPNIANQRAALHASQQLVDLAQYSTDQVLQRLNSTIGGLSTTEAEERLETYGLNEVAREKRQSLLKRLWETGKNPLVILLLALAFVSFVTGDMRATVVISLMVVLGVSLRFFQELRADLAAERLKAMVTTTATVVRDGQAQEIPLKFLVPGDVIRLSAGDMVPADVRLIASKDLFVNQAALTGEALPVEKLATIQTPAAKNPLEIPNVCFLGTNVESGTATAVVVLTGENTYFGSLASRIVGQRVVTSFDKGIDSFTWLMIRFMLVMVPAVFLINGLSKGDWLEAFFFALAVAVGLTPEMLPMIVTVNLSKGAIAMSHKKAIVKRLNAIQNFGAMDVLCTDKTGTLTEGRIVLEKHLDIHGDENDDILDYAYLNSFYQTGLKSMLDDAVLSHTGPDEQEAVKARYRKVDEIPFDFVRRRMSVVVADQLDGHRLICKGAVEEVLSLCTRLDAHGQILPLKETDFAEAKALVDRLNADGFRVVALAYKEMPGTQSEYTVKDETDLILLGFLAFLDPPKATASDAIRALHDSQIRIKVLTGDNEIVTGRICQEVGLTISPMLLGNQIENMTDAELAEAADKSTVFAKLSPIHKERIIRALQRRGHVVGFLGDGINDAPALRAADVGISVDSAVDIAKESSDIILLETSLTVLQEGVIEGRKVFGNIIKYIKMAASSNFGNMFSVVGGSLFLPFLPMLPMQILVNNLLYDFSQTTIPTDGVDAEWLSRPRKWAIGDLRRFILFIGPISSIFDYLTFFIMLYVFNAWHKPELFHTGWFVESLFTQTLIIHVIRTNKIPFIQSRASLPLTLTSILIVGIGAALPLSPLAGALGFTPLPVAYWGLLALMLVSYIVLTQIVKTWFVHTYEA